MAFGDRKRVRIGGAVFVIGCSALNQKVDAFSPPAQFHSSTRQTGARQSHNTKLSKRRTGTSLFASSSPDDYHKHSSGWSTHNEGGFHHPKSGLSAATLTEIPAGTYDFPDFDNAKDMLSLNTRRLQSLSGGEDAKNLLSAALTITGNTVGASILCLPSYVSGPGMQISTALLMGIFGINLISGLLIAEVAIKQHEESDGDVPSSFKDFADATLENPLAGNSIAAVSIFTNMCVLSYSLMQAGDFAHGFGVDGTLAATGVAAVLIALVGSQTNSALSGVTSLACTVLFASFAGILLPGMANVQDPIGTLFAPGTATTSTMDSSLAAIPIFLSAMVYQNIVPSITKLLNYDRKQSTIAIFLGSLIPMLMYMSFSFAVLGGGIDSSAATGGVCLTVFSAAALTGSSIAGIMSIAEELDSILNKIRGFSPMTNERGLSLEAPKATEQRFSLPSVLLSVAPPLFAGLLLSGGESFSAALKYSGGYSSPALYGVLPVVLAMAQSKKEQDTRDTATMEQESLVPGGFASLSLLGAASAGFVGQEFMVDMSSVFSSAVGAVA
mmetsp:Transcript_46810/g.141790  ORF Transcript_46810/g.141790 Transcript_46810/m.141790 type:complete len:555 (-) Transcript_46810:224-1888(-)|eukprot:CAMPEP_0113552086 /NCGR_PEP_ID=MMETSP0015_2-20120614/14874_1 /TAXON_ID=2838 /ORGANISM="Odontella" /LENGTH=554 /DNA_ID=CAMNT_0000453029 /DNA_START=180 /DNA_END=1844 /DNA_ORIENTATION=+ /assembly_acc=CAM_ASM_000160